MRLLVTGGAGFIGANLIHYLISKYPGYEIINLDRLSYSGNLQSLEDVQQLPMYHFIQGDVCNEVEVDAIMSQGIDAVIHLASEPHPNPEESDPSRFIRSDMYGTYVLCEAAAAYKVERFIHISTALGYGVGRMHAGTVRPAAETDELRPLGPHIASRVGSERLAYSYFATHSLPVTMARLSSVYGVYQYPDHQPASWITAAIANEPIELGGQGQAAFDWIHVVDVCSGIDALLHARRNEVEGEIFNVGTGHARTQIEVAELIINFLDRPRQLIAVDDSPVMGGVAVDTSKLEKLGWSAKKDFHQGLADTINWYQGRRDWWEKLWQPSPESVLQMPTMEVEVL
jgi:dTDP-glucose 4,6-dehydratase